MCGFPQALLKLRALDKNRNTWALKEGIKFQWWSPRVKKYQLETGNTQVLAIFLSSCLFTSIPSHLLHGMSLAMGLYGHCMIFRGSGPEDNCCEQFLSSSCEEHNWNKLQQSVSWLVEPRLTKRKESSRISESTPNPKPVTPHDREISFTQNRMWHSGAPVSESCQKHSFKKFLVITVMLHLTCLPILKRLFLLILI